MNTTTIEMVSYQLKPGVTEEQLQRTHSALNSFCLAQPGFLYRSVSQDEHQTWFDVIYWRGIEDAIQADSAFRESPAGQSLLGLINHQSVKMRHMLAEAEAYSSMLAMYAGTCRSFSN